MVLEGSTLHLDEVGGIYDPKVIERFKKIILEMHDGVPQFYFFGLLENLIPNEEIRNYFFEKDVFVKSKYKDEFGKIQYFLGVNGRVLANNYKTERLTEKMMKLNSHIRGLTWILLLLTVMMFIISFFNFLV